MKVHSVATRVAAFLPRSPFERRREPRLLHRVDELIDADQRRIEGDARFLVAEAHVRPTHALEPLQGSLDREGSRPSGHALHGQHDRRWRRRRSVHRQYQEQHDEP